MTNATNIVQSALDLQANHNKLEIINMARSLGWKGDHARSPILQLALYVATKLASGEHHSKDHGAPQGQGDEQQQPEQNAPSSQAKPSQSTQDEQQPEQQGQAPTLPQESSQGAPQQPEQPEQQQPEQPEQQDEQQPEQPLPNEFEQLLKASGIVKPHLLLQKVWLLSSKAKQNVLLVGPAGCGKTMLAAQLAQLLRVPFGSISCTMGMSESQLTGWLLPVGDNGRFDYVSAPFVTCLQQPSVFLLDELDAADPNVLMLGNSVWSNGFITIPHKLSSPTIQRHEDAIVIAGANTMGTGADDLYSARAALDGATVDRFYPVIVEYDESYEHGIFSVQGRKSSKRSPKWEPAAVPDQDGFDNLRSWFFTLRAKVKQAKLSKIISSRLAQRLVAAVAVGIPQEEVKTDLLLGWSADELARVGVK